MDFSSFQPNARGAEETSGGPRKSHCDCTCMADSNLVALPMSNTHRTTVRTDQQETPLNTAFRSESSSPPVSQPQTHGLPLIREKLQRQNILTRAQEIILKSWRLGTQKQYRVYLLKWMDFCHNKTSVPWNQEYPVYWTFLQNCLMIIWDILP